MKKLVAILAVSALVAVGAFAQGFNIGGGTIVSADLMQGDNGEDSEITSSGSAVIRIQASGSAETAVGTFGAWVRLQPSWMGFGANHQDWPNNAQPTFNGHAWWTPSDVFRLTMGTHPGGWWDMSGRARWGFYRMPNDVFSPGFGIAHNYAGAPPGWDAASPWFVSAGSFNHSFYQGHHAGMMFEINPTPDTNLVNIRLNLPMGFGQPHYGMNGAEFSDLLAAIHAQVQINLHGTGTIGLTYRGVGTDSHWRGGGEDDSGAIFAYFGLSAIENIGIDFGVGFHLVDEDPVIGIGLAADIGITPEFNLQARVHAEIDTMEDAPFGLLFELLPSYNITPNVRGFLSFGLALNSPSEGDATMGFHVGPFVEVGSTWGPSFYAGFELLNITPGGGDSVMRWRVPVGLNLLVW